ncbi:MAG: MATE family efflux transporter [Gemmatimonadales bacterium]
MSVSSSASSPSGGTLQSGLRAIREALGGAQHDYTSGSLSRAITLLAIPMVLEMAMESVFAICDVFFVSRLGDAAVATVGLTESMLTLIYAIAIGLSMATTALVARRIGEKNTDGATRAAKQAIVVGVLFGAATGLPCALFAGDLLALMGAEQVVIDTGSGFTAILMGTNVVILLLFLNNAIFRGAGDAVLAMRALGLANGINLVLDPCLIFGLGPFPELGVTGAAVATAIGRGSGVLYQFWMLRRQHSRIVLRPPLFRVEPQIMRELLRLSVGGVTQFLIATASWVVLMRLVSPYGKSAVAGYTIAVRIVVFALLPAWGLSNAAATLVGQNLGARQPERAERSVWLTGYFNTAFLALVTVVFLVFNRQLVSIFSDRPDTIQYGADALRIISYGYVFYAWGMVVTQAFNGAGDTMTPTWINLVCFWFLQIPLAWTLARGIDRGPSGVFWAVALAEAVLAVMSIVIFRRGRWKETQLAPDVEATDG